MELLMKGVGVWANVGPYESTCALSDESRDREGLYEKTQLAVDGQDIWEMKKILFNVWLDRSGFWHKNFGYGQGHQPNNRWYLYLLKQIEGMKKQ